MFRTRKSLAIRSSARFSMLPSSFDLLSGPSLVMLSRTTRTPYSVSVADLTSLFGQYVYSQDNFLVTIEGTKN